MKYKLICTDMDGTLLSHSGNISDRNVEAIKRAIDKGVKVAISTGRIFTSADFYAKLIGVKIPVIAANGAVIIEKDEDRVVYKGDISEQSIRNLIKIGEEEGLMPYFYTVNEVLIHSGLPASSREDIELMYNNNSDGEKVVYIREYDDWDELIKNNINDIIKCTIIDVDHDRTDRIIEKMKYEEELYTTYARFPKDNLGDMTVVESTRKDVNKGNGVKILSEFYGIKREEIMCIGDSGNDLSMIGYAGLGVAMGNATEEIKSIAGYITDTNENSGVAKAIEKFVLEVK